MSNAQTRGWGTGWPHCQPDKLVTVTLNARGLRLPVRREMAVLVAWLCAETERRGYRIKTGETWTYACRPIRGLNVASNHSWGLAVDINAPENPMKQRPIVTDMPVWLPTLWKAHGFGWGGDYPMRVDAMHMEFLLTPADAAQITAALHTPDAPLGWVTIHPGAKGGPTKVIQQLLTDVNRKRPLFDCNPGKVDGDYGPNTTRAMQRFKLHVDALQVAFHQRPSFTVINGDADQLALGALQYWAK